MIAEMSEPKCVEIAGGGLAGLSLGIGLRARGVPVRVIEAGVYPRHRVCGEFISGVTDDELRALGIEDLLENAKRHLSTIWFDEGGELMRGDLPEAARGVSRFSLDLRLVERLRELGGEVLTGSRFEGASGGREGLVLATGRLRRDSKWLGLKAHYLNLPLEAGLEVHVTGKGYVGMTEVEGGRVNVCGLFERGEALGAGGRGGAVVRAVREAGLGDLANRLEAANVDERSVTGVKQFLLGWQPRAGVDELRLGDQAAMIPPFTGNGMSMAFQGALDAVEPLVAWSKGRMVWRAAVGEVRKACGKRFRARLRWSWLLHGLLLSRGGRQICVGLVRQGWLPFESIYRRVR